MMLFILPDKDRALGIGGTCLDPGKAGGEDIGIMAKRWYSVSVLSNFEKKVAEAIRQAVAEKALEDEIDEVLVPTEEVIEIRRGKKVTSERRFMPGYVLVRMELNDKTYHLVNSINRVTGFLGAQGKPMPMRDDEVNRSCIAPARAGSKSRRAT
jgi:transcription antitermination factor NusG